MSEINLGRVQGGGIFYSTASSGTSIAKSTLTPMGLVPLVGDCVVFPNGDLRKITAVSGTSRATRAIRARQARLSKPPQNGRAKTPFSERACSATILPTKSSRWATAQRRGTRSPHFQRRGLHLPPPSGAIYPALPPRAARKSISTSATKKRSNLQRAKRLRS